MTEHSMGERKTCQVSVRSGWTEVCTLSWSTSTFGRGKLSLCARVNDVDGKRRRKGSGNENRSSDSEGGLLLGCLDSWSCPLNLPTTAVCATCNIITDDQRLLPLYPSMSKVHRYLIQSTSVLGFNFGERSTWVVLLH